MRNKENISRAARYYIIRSKDSLVNFAIFASWGFVYILALYKGVFNDRGEEYLVLLLYALILGIATISANSMVVDLTVKDKLNRRIDFLLASGVDIKDVVKSYSLEMWKIANIVPFFIFFLTYVIYDFNLDFKLILGIYITSVLFSYSQTLYFNILSMYRKNYKFFKNVMFFLTSILIYLVGTFAEKIIISTKTLNVNIFFLIICINSLATILILTSTFLKLKKMTNESVIRSEGTWS